MSATVSVDLCSVFKDRAEWVWGRLGQARTRRFTFSETTITELLLLDLVENAPTAVTVVPFKPAEERINGADWQWCFADASMSRFAEARVQAKRLHDDCRYGSLMHKYRSGKPLYQMSRFIQEANKARLPALYIFYNHLKAGERSLLPSTDTPEHWGCSYALASMVRGCVYLTPRGYSGTSFNEVGKVSRPWHELVCPNGSHEQPERLSLPDRFAARIRSHASQPDTPHLRQAVVQEDLFGSDGEDGIDLTKYEPTDTPPVYLELLQPSMRDDPKSGFIIPSREQLDRLRSAVGETSGVVVLREPHERLPSGEAE